MAGSQVHPCPLSDGRRDDLLDVDDQLLFQLKGRDLDALYLDPAAQEPKHRRRHLAPEVHGDGYLVKVIWWDGRAACMFMKWLERGRFVWPSAREGKVALTPAQLSMLLEGIDWCAPARSWWTCSALPMASICCTGICRSAGVAARSGTEMDSNEAHKPSARLIPASRVQRVAGVSSGLAKTVRSMASATRSALAAMVREGLVPPLVGRNDASTT
ncbi:Transposase [Paracoccus yeei]